MTQVHARVAKADAGERGSEQHLALGLHVVRVLDRARQVLDAVPQRLQREDVADGVRALVRGPQDGVRGARHPLVVGDGGPALEGVAQDVEAGARLDGGGHGARVERVADAQRGLEVAVGDASLCALGDEVEDGGAGGLGPGARGGGHRDEGLEGLVDGPAVAEGRVDEVEEVCVGVRRVQVHQLGRVDDRAASYREEGIRVEGLGPVYGLADAVSQVSLMKTQPCTNIHHGGNGSRAVLGLDPGVVEDAEVHTFSRQRVADLIHGRQLVHGLIRDDADPLGAHVLQVHADLAGCAVAKADGGGSHLEGVLLELRVILRSGITPHGGTRPTVVVVMMGWVRVAWARGRVGELHSPEQIHCPRRGLGEESISIISLWAWCYTRTHAGYYSNGRRHGDCMSD